MKRVFIVISSATIGGTQKRLVSLWNDIQERGHKGVTCVLSEPLFSVLASDASLTRLQRSNPDLIVVKARRFREMLLPLAKIAVRAGRGAVFHYPLASLPCIHTLLGQKVIRSIPMSDLSMLIADRYTALLYYQLIRAYRIDVLNPRVIAQLRRHWLLRHFVLDKIRLTKGSSIRLPERVDAALKKNWIVFLGRFTDQANDVKNILTYIEQLPAVFAALKAHPVPDVRFFILGYGPLEAEIKSRLQRPEYRDLPIECRFEPRPDAVLRQSKVILSLQKFTNYPSRSVLEAMAHGNLPVITDVGESRLLADEDCAAFIPGDFTAADLSRAIRRQLSIPLPEYRRKVELMRAHVASAFSFDAHRRYYLELYDRGTADDD